jgi:hypothetical protein
MVGEFGAAPGVDGVDIAGPQFVVYALLDISLGAEEFLECRGRVEHNAVWAVSKLGT